MEYEWDDDRARRTHFLKMALVLVVTSATCGLPLWLIVRAIE